MTDQTPEQPEWAKDLQKALQNTAAELGKGFNQMSRILAAQGAMGWAYRGDLEAARKALATLPPDHLQEISAAAAVLASLADETLRERR
ncbi:hypothetical protein FHS43_000557 [Streptosporangium becharense]|uniref:Uncharacterized protein n=1 Tax=Streptosporangium becharense TaxID=1816182 RepID=A0A7W9INE6_9ACTN|nr:hypothetical protein [Streptosporangium becharense]MBB2909311.1 hypothetical protein [Streptosporangium becharense]MBB5823786.1 hypothetical protein [Streptosporangium becharense]